MSLLLDALKKADQERRESESGPSIEADHSTAIDQPKRKNIFLLAILVVAVICVGIVLWLLTSNGEQAKDEVAQPTKPAAVENEAQKIRTTDVAADLGQDTEQQNTETRTAQLKAAPKANNVKSTQEQTQIAALYAETPAPEIIDNGAQESKLSNNPKFNPKFQAKTEQKKNPKLNIESQSKPTSDSTITPEPVRTPPPKRVVESLSNYASTDFIKELPFTVQEKIPSVIYSQHQFNPDGASMVVINGKEITEGRWIDNGLQLRKILSDGILLEYEKRPFKMRALNSWLNY